MRRSDNGVWVAGSAIVRCNLRVTAVRRLCPSLRHMARRLRTPRCCLVESANAIYIHYSFFFQAEDGIRDYKVTGVQTCALPISGAGPRHIAFHPTLPLVFVANELDSTVATLRFDADRGALSLVDTRSTIPAGWGRAGTNYPADIHVAANGRTLYVSNRGHNSIAVFSVAESTGALALDQ